MRALIMAGGAGSRLGLGEKPLIPVCDRPMISYVIDAFLAAGCEPVVVASSRTPMTINWCRARGIAVARAGGEGFIDDMIKTVHELEEVSPIIVSVSDIPCITPEIILASIQQYRSCGKDALSTWVPASLVKSCRDSMPYREKVGDVEACPAGFNLLLGDRIDCEQEEFRLLLDEPRMALNINTREDLSRAELFLRHCITDPDA
jgi:adenosylcobinamide-phosphate guanylyltransferase